MTDKLEIQFPSQGWKQFLTSRKEMLDAYDRACEKAKSHEVEVYQGKVAEAELRKWLSRFLPKRYGVTSGYVVSPGLKSNQKTPHFDVIIYDQLEAPILWVEDSPDASEQGKSRAIPVEYVQCILEVKSQLSSKTCADGIEHLGDLIPLMGGPDEPGERYKLHLPTTFFCGLVFFDLKRKNEFNYAALTKFVDGVGLRGFFGGIVLRGEGIQEQSTGKVSLLRFDKPIDAPLENTKSSLLLFGMTGCIKITDTLYLGAMLMWQESNFAQFGFDVLAMMRGTYDIRFVSSFYGMGSSHWEQAIPEKTGA
ncbi:MAG TPA: DUF6602 domain-containing protein [Candidatus Udaeobacter sp.]|nr:DUF6602 domain-containing protein [Candidatus Udaeobacter sp.]